MVKDKLKKEIECPGENLETLLLYGNQIHAYNSISGEPNPKNTDEETIVYYHMGKKLAKIFRHNDGGKELFDSLKAHAETHQECAKKMNELREKYQALKPEELAKLTPDSKANLVYCGILNQTNEPA